MYYNLYEQGKYIPDEVRIGAFFYNEDIEKIEEILKPICTKKEIEYIKDKFDSLRREEFMFTQTEFDNFNRYFYEMELAKAKEEGLNQGISQGIEQNSNNTIINLLNKGMNVEFISEVVNKPKEYVLKIKNDQKL